MSFDCEIEVPKWYYIVDCLIMHKHVNRSCVCAKYCRKLIQDHLESLFTLNIQSTLKTPIDYILINSFHHSLQLLMLVLNKKEAN